MRVLFALLVALPAVASTARGGQLEVHLVDQKGKPADSGVVVAVPLSGGAAKAGDQAVMDQINEAFVPDVLPVVAGTKVIFPNQDDIRHHVYSFSDAKKFELPLYKGTPAEPVVFDRPGVIVLGCNIHDHMRGYIYVAESPYYAVTGDDGKAVIENLPAGDYRLEAWHPQQKKAVAARQISVGATPVRQEIALDLKPSLRLRAGAARGKKYR